MKQDSILKDDLPVWEEQKKKSFNDKIQTILDLKIKQAVEGVLSFDYLSYCWDLNIYEKRFPPLLI